MFPQDFIAKDGRTVTIRRVRTSDAPAAIKYINELAHQTDYLSFGAGEFTRTAEEQAARYEKRSADDNHLSLLAIVDSSIAGMIQFGTGNRIRTRHTGDFGMSVHQDFARLGIGRRLLQCVIDWARHVGFVKKINLSVRTDNEPAICLYKQMGFRTEGTITRDYLVDGRYYDSFRMGLEID